MDVYHIWCDLRDGREDKAFAAAVAAYLDHHKAGGRIVGWRLLRRKLGLGPDGMGEFHIMIETTDMAQLDKAFRAAATRSGDVEKLHAAVYSRVTNARFALARDFPDR
ncbi:MAG: hypothetical protein GC155_16215 [Alphaproteobacteria bacterium]|nr:hypothetical protein [Alphaproteobacteria bacterium]